MRLVGLLALLAGFAAGCSRPSVKECSSDSSCPAGSSCVEGLCTYVGVSCSDVQRMGASIGDGQYVIRPGGGDAFTVWCDMTTDGGGWTLVGWSGNLGAAPPSGIPYPGLKPCPTLDCVRGTAASRTQLEALIRSSTEFGKGRSSTATSVGAPGFLTRLGLYAEAGKYTYGSLGAVRLASGAGTCSETGQLEGWFRTLKGPNTHDSVPVRLNLELATGIYDYTSDGAVPGYRFTIGTPGGGCDSASGSAMPGSWMGNLTPDYGPNQAATSGASSLWVRGETEPAPPSSCRHIMERGGSRGDGVYWLKPGVGPVFQVLCDMTTDGGGWTMVYYVDAAHFDGVAANNASTSPNAPLALNDRSDIWNAGASLWFGQTLFACKPDAQAATAPSFWRYGSAGPFDWFANVTDRGCVGSLYPTASSSTPGPTSIAADKAIDGSTHGFLAIGIGSACTECANLVFGMNHYTDGTCRSKHPGTAYTLESLSGRTYPVCNGQQTTSGLFWIAVR